MEQASLGRAEGCNPGARREQMGLGRAGQSNAECTATGTEGAFSERGEWRDARECAVSSGSCRVSCAWWMVHGDHLQGPGDFAERETGAHAEGYASRAAKRYQGKDDGHALPRAGPVRSRLRWLHTYAR